MGLNQTLLPKTFDFCKAQDKSVQIQTQIPKVKLPLQFLPGSKNRSEVFQSQTSLLCQLLNLKTPKQNNIHSTTIYKQGSKNWRCYKHVVLTNPSANPILLQQRQNSELGMTGQKWRYQIYMVLPESCCDPWLIPGTATNRVCSST